MCSAHTRWVEYPVDAEGVYGTGGGIREGRGTSAYSMATGAPDTDSFNIGTANNRLHFSVNGEDAYVTLASGVGLDPRFVARDITEKIHNLGKNEPAWNQARCVWENNRLKLYSGALGSGTSITVVSGTNTAHIELGFGTKVEVGGSNDSPRGTNNYPSGVTVSGTYNGFFDEVYDIMINKEYNISAPVKGGSNNYTGTMTIGGIYHHSASDVYDIRINTTNGTTMGAGTGNVPKMSWTSSLGDNSATAVELLYPNYWYYVGTKGLKVKFTDAVFNHCVDSAAWTVACTHPQYTFGSNVQGAAGSALYIWSSSRGDDLGPNQALVTSEEEFTRLGSRGLFIKFNGSGNLFQAGDMFKVICTPPQPKSYDVTNLSYGNVTVSTESPVKCVMFEIMSGAIEMSTVKFGLQSHGTFQHHKENNNDTYFRFGTVGPGQNAGSSPVDKLEWRANTSASDLSSDIPPSYMYSTKENLSVVVDADDSENIGASGFMGMTSDPIWVNIRLGASEVGANSTINHRIFFDYS